jgi:hypothetical protein
VNPESPASAAAQPPVPRNLPRQRWALAEPHPEAAAALAKAARLPLVLAELLVARGITQAQEAFAFLNPEPAHLNDPFLMLGMNEAVARLERAIAAREPVLLYGDYDVDGTTAVVLLKTARLAFMCLTGCWRVTACNPACWKRLAPTAFAWLSRWTPA